MGEVTKTIPDYSHMRRSGRCASVQRDSKEIALQIGLREDVGRRIWSRRDQFVIVHAGTWNRLRRCQVYSAGGEIRQRLACRQGKTH